jgi:Holliday junction resolvase-like predicted endonuclease
MERLMDKIVDVREVQEQLDKAARDAKHGPADIRAGRFIHEDAMAATLAPDVTTDWFWEGNVVEALARYLESNGWVIVNKANTRSKERGVDIHALKGQTALFVEVKGYPSTNYRDPKRAAERKPTNPTNQSQQWYSHALLKALRLQTKHPGSKIALGLPDFPRYRALFDETKMGFERLGLALLTVKANGDVQAWGLE